MECFLGDIELSLSASTSGRLQLRTKGMAQDGATRGGMFHGEMDRCRESQGWTMACSRMPEHDGKNEGEDSPKQACSCWFARHSCLARSGANLYPPGFVWLANAELSFSGVTFVLVFLLLFKLRPFVQLFLEMHAPRQPRAVS